MARAKQIIKSKKFFSRNTPPTCNVHLTSRDFYLRKNKKVCLGFSQGRPPRAKSTPLQIMRRRAVDESAGRCFPFVQVAQKLLANFVQHYLLTSSRNYGIIIIEIIIELLKS